MTNPISRRSPIPLYYQVESLLREELTSGRYATRVPLPTETDLVCRFGVSRITVRRALENSAAQWDKLKAGYYKK